MNKLCKYDVYMMFKKALLMQNIAFPLALYELPNLRAHAERSSWGAAFSAVFLFITINLINLTKPFFWFYFN